MKHCPLILLCLAFAAQLHATEEKTIRGKAVFDNNVNLPIAGALVTYQPNYTTRERTIELTADENGDFEIQAQNVPVYVEVMTPDKNFGKIVIVQPTENEFLASLELTATIRGKVVDLRDGRPAVGLNVYYTFSVRIDETNTVFLPFQRETKTNENGEYEFRNLPTGFNGYVSLPLYYYGEGENQFYTMESLGFSSALLPGERRELGEFPLDLRPGWDYEYFFQMYNVYTMRRYAGEPNRFERRFELLLERAKRDSKGIFVIFVRDKLEEKDLDALKNIYKILFDDDEVFTQTERFYMMCILMQPNERESRVITADSAVEFTKSHRIETPLPSLFSFAFFDADGKLRGVERFDPTSPETKQKRDLMEMLREYGERPHRVTQWSLLR